MSRSIAVALLASLGLAVLSQRAQAVEAFPVIKNPSIDFDEATEDNSAALGRPFSFADPGSPYGVDINGS